MIIIIIYLKWSIFLNSEGLEPAKACALPPSIELLTGLGPAKGLSQENGN